MAATRIAVSLLLYSSRFFCLSNFIARALETDPIAELCPPITLTGLVVSRVSDALLQNQAADNRISDASLLSPSPASDIVSLSPPSVRKSISAISGNSKME